MKWCLKPDCYHMKTLCSVSTPSQKCGDPFLVFYVQIYLFAIHVVSKSHNACLAKLIAMQRAGVIEESQFPLPVGWGTRLFSALPHFLAQLLFGSYWWKVSAIHEKQRPFNWANGANYKGNVVKISFLNWMLPAIKRSQRGEVMREHSRWKLLLPAHTRC